MSSRLTAAPQPRSSTIVSRRKPGKLSASSRRQRSMCSVSASRYSECRRRHSSSLSACAAASLQLRRPRLLAALGRLLKSLAEVHRHARVSAIESGRDKESGRQGDHDATSSPLPVSPSPALRSCHSRRPPVCPAHHPALRRRVLRLRLLLDGIAAGRRTTAWLPCLLPSPW